jgi:hypothetical protein
MNSHTVRYVEVAILSAVFVLGGELLLQRAPGIETFSVTVAGLMRWLLFVLGCVAAGYWLRARIAGESSAVVAVGAAIGVAFAFGDRLYRGDAELPHELSDLALMFGMALANWLAFVIGSVLSARRSSHEAVKVARGGA